MPYICIREARRPGKQRLDDISMDLTVCDLKTRAESMVRIPAVEQNLIYGGQVLKDNKSLVSCGLKDGCTVHIVRKLIEPEPIEQDKENISVDNVMNVLEAAIKSPTYRNTVEKILSNPEMLEQLVAATPGLSDDPVAMTLLKDRELLQQVIETADIEKVVREHPSLVQAASYIAAAAASDNSAGTSVRSMMEDADGEMRDIEPGLLAQAEMVAAHEERIQSSQAARAQAVTPFMLASALASAGMPSSSREGQATSSDPFAAGPSGVNPSTSATAGPSSGSTSGSVPSTVTRDLFSQAMSTAMGRPAAGSSSSSSELTESQLQSQLQQLRDMGITDSEASLRALRASGGDVQAALELIFGGT